MSLVSVEIAILGSAVFGATAWVAIDSLKKAVEVENVQVVFAPHQDIFASQTAVRLPGQSKSMTQEVTIESSVREGCDCLMEVLLSVPGFDDEVINGFDERFEELVAALLPVVQQFVESVTLSTFTSVNASVNNAK